MSMESGSITAVDQSNRFAPITEDNHSGLLWVTSILCLVYSVLIIVARLHIKWKMYGADDVTALAATVRNTLADTVSV